MAFKVIQNLDHGNVVLASNFKTLKAAKDWANKRKTYCTK